MDVTDPAVLARLEEEKAEAASGADGGVGAEKPETKFD